MAISSEGLECFGGQGYIEETGLPGILRDAQVLPIWEGTSNVMSLDVLRSASKSGGAVMDALKARVWRTCGEGRRSADAVVAGAAAEVEAAAAATLQFLTHNPRLAEVGARDLTVSLARIYIATLLLEHCLSGSAVAGDASDRTTLRLWLEKELAPVVANFEKGSYEDDVNSYKSYVLEGYDENNLSN